MADIDRYFQTLGVPGQPCSSIRRARSHVASFDEKSPFKPSYLWLVSQTVPAARIGARFVHSLATLDSQVIVDGGWTLPMGEEDSVRNLIAAGRALPAVSFHTVEVEQPACTAARSGDHPAAVAEEDDNASPEVSQPVTFRGALRRPHLSLRGQRRPLSHHRAHPRQRQPRLSNRGTQRRAKDRAVAGRRQAPASPGKWNWSPMT